MAREESNLYYMVQHCESIVKYIGFREPNMYFNYEFVTEFDYFGRTFEWVLVII